MKLFKTREHSCVFRRIWCVYGRGVRRETGLDFKRVFQGVFNMLNGGFLDLLRCFQELERLNFRSEIRSLLSNNWKLWVFGASS